MEAKASLYTFTFERHIRAELALTLYNHQLRLLDERHTDDFKGYVSV